MKRKTEDKTTLNIKTSKVEGLEKKIKKKPKPVTKNELSIQYKYLEEKHEKLVRENAKNLEAIAALESRVQLLQVNSKSIDSKLSSDTDL